MHSTYHPEKIEKKWQEFWEQNKSFEVIEDYSLKKYYLLEMFPYPSGKIHMGHVRVYTIGDVIARYKRMCGYNVLHPMGWDAFGLPAENAAIANNTHPAEWTYKNIKEMKVQLKRLGFSYDWSREITTCKSEYYRWEQWLFIKMLEKGMVYRKKTFVNWCETCETVLANEQVEEDLCWRCSSTISQKKLWQWFFRITDYSDDLLVSCKKLYGWPEKVKTMQKNWIGKSLGVKINFIVENHDYNITVFTTRPDTVYGVTFISVAPEHPIVSSLFKKSEIYHKISDFVESTLLKKRSNRTINNYDKEGIFSGFYCFNPTSGDKIPIYVANFALIEHGTGAVMSVPAHDYRDFDFAKKYNLPIKVVIDSGEIPANTFSREDVFVGEGPMVNSGSFNGMLNTEASNLIIKYLEEQKFGYRTINYKLRDWGVSRQRYWGAPIPIVYCDTCGVVPVEEEKLPVLLPEESNSLRGGNSVLSKISNFVQTDCPNCSNPDARRETDTMDTFVESSWYFERYCSPNEDKLIFNKEAVNYWMPVDQYIGGIEHAILHLLYSRYFNRVLKELGLINFNEPFLNVLTQGMVCKETFKCSNHGFIFPEEVMKDKGNYSCMKCGESVVIGKIEKMSKSKKNVIDPNFLIKKYGADTVRLFCLFAAPPEKDLEWNENAVEGIFKFLNRVWKIAFNWTELRSGKGEINIKEEFLSSSFRDLLSKTHETIKKVTDSIDKRFSFNTAISSIMELVNVMYKKKPLIKNDFERNVMKFSLGKVIILLYPMVPHFSEELWFKMGNKERLTKYEWPKYNDEIIKKNIIPLVIQINGKLRKVIKIKRDIDEETLKKIALSDDKISNFIGIKKIKKTIFIKNKVLNIVV